MVRDAIRGLPEIYVELYLALPKRSGAGTEQRVSGSREQPTPLHLHVDALMREMNQVMTSWHELVEIIDTQGRRRSGVEIQLAARALDARFRVFSRLDPTPVVRGKRIIELSGIEGCLELLRLYARARRLLGIEQVIEVREAPCPQCSAYALTRVSGDHFSRCEACAFRVDEDAYQEWCEQLLTAHS